MRIMKAFLIAALAVFSGLSPARADSAQAVRQIQAALVTVGSSYADENSSKTAKIQGQGFIAKKGSRFFVICDSHLSQGGDLRIRSIQSALSILPGQRLADNDADLEIFEIADPGIRPVFEYADTLGGFVISVPGAKAGELSDSSAFVRVTRHGFTPVSANLSAKAKPYHAPTPEQRQELAEHHGDRAFEGLTYGAMGKELVADSGIVPGMSGGPLLMSSDDGKVGVIGLAKAFNNRKLRSYFSTPDQIRSVLGAFEAGKRGTTSKTTWRYRKSTYRDFGNGTWEINPEQRPSGGESTDGGGESTDGGDSAQSGKAQDSQNRYGMRVDGKPALAFDFGKLAVFANRVSLAFIRDRGGPDAPLHAVDEEHVDFERLLKQRTSNGVIAEATGESARSLPCVIDEGRLGRGVLRIRLTLSSSKTEEPVILELDRRGMASSTRKPYDPIIELANKTLIDTRGLFFFDPSQVEVPKDASYDVAKFYASFVKGAYLSISERGAMERPVLCAKSKDSKLFERPSGPGEQDHSNCLNRSEVSSGAPAVLMRDIDRVVKAGPR